VLRKSQDYTELKKSYVIFICTFDPFPKNKLKLYTFTNRCHEKSDLDLGDDAVKIFLNTKGNFGKVDNDIDKFLAYIDGKAAEGKFTKDIAAEAERIKQHKETRLEYMTLMAELQDQRREGENSGRIKNIINNVRSLMKKKGWSLDEAFDVLDVSPKDRAAAIAGL
ncbi:MAG: hypothetical protein IKN43_06850, partial [Selenomonadaceae bacterium]|nr:hypothetical protein [Selenomonadaceae bacterium]